MFARSDLGTPVQKPPDRSRLVGAVVLVIILIVVLFVALGADATFITPLNIANEQATQTWQYTHPVLPPGHPTIPPFQQPSDPDRPSPV